MKKPQLTTLEPKVSSPWDRLENFVREHIQRFIQSPPETEMLVGTRAPGRGVPRAESVRGVRTAYEVF